PRLVVITWVEKPQVVPARARPLRHGVGLAREPATVALEEAPVGDARERAGRVLARVVVGELGQAQWQLGLVDRERLVIADGVRGPSPRVAGRVSELDRKVD